MAGRVADVAPLPAEIFLIIRAQRQESSRHAVQVASVIFYLGGSIAARFSFDGWLIQRPPPQRGQRGNTTGKRRLKARCVKIKQN
jgi:hypothetical protein